MWNTIWIIVAALIGLLLLANWGGIIGYVVDRCRHPEKTGGFSFAPPFLGGVVGCVWCFISPIENVRSFAWLPLLLDPSIFLISIILILQRTISACRWICRATKCWRGSSSKVACRSLEHRMRSLLCLWAAVLCVGGCAVKPPPTPAAIPVGISEDFLYNWDRVEHAQADLDHDGVAEWFLGNPSTRGNAGLSYLVLQRRGEAWYPIGELFLHPGAFRVLPTASDGSIRVVRYHRVSGSEGTLDRMTWRDGEFVVLNSEKIHPGDGGTEEGRRRYAEVFAEGTGLNQRRP